MTITVTNQQARTLAYEGEVGEEYGKSWDGESNEWEHWQLAEDAQYVTARRWGDVYRIVLKDPDGKYWGLEYTEAGEGAGDSYSDEESDLFEVFPSEKVVTVYTTNPPETPAIFIGFTPEQFSAMWELLGLIHYDMLATEWRALLPPALLEALNATRSISE